MASALDDDADYYVDVETTVASLVYQKNLALYNTVKCFETKDKRHIFHIVRASQETLSKNTFLPVYGMTAGKFAVFQILTENMRRSSKSSRSRAR